MKYKSEKPTMKKYILIGIGLFVLIMFILPFGYFLITGEFPKGYPIQIGGKETGTKEVQPVTKYVCPDETIVTSPELCPKKEQPTTETTVPSQSLIEGKIKLNLGIVQEDAKSYLTSWYNEFYPILENITGGPCEPFTANVVYSSVGAGGRFEETTGIGGDANLIFNMPLDKSKPYDPNFDSRFGHEFSHGFMNGIRTAGTTPRGGMATISFISEGFTEMTISSALFELTKKGKTDYEGLHFYLPYAIAGYDSYAVQGKNTAGGALMWKAEITGYYYMQAEAVWYLLEQAKPGFTKQFLREACALPQIKSPNWNGIILSYDKFKDIVKKVFGNEKIEGKLVLEWLDSQPITNINGESGNYIRIQFRDKTTRETVYRDEGRSINPKVLLITAVQRTLDPGEGARDTMIGVSPSIKLTDWQGKVTNVGGDITSIISRGGPYSATLPSLSQGAYKVEVSDSSLNAKTTTYFIITDKVDEDSLYGIKLENGNIIVSGSLKTSLGDVAISNGYFKLKVTSNINEISFPDVGRTVLKPADMARMIILQN